MTQETETRDPQALAEQLAKAWPLPRPTTATDDDMTALGFSMRCGVDVMKPGGPTMNAAVMSTLAQSCADMGLYPGLCLLRVATREDGGFDATIWAPEFMKTAQRDTDAGPAPAASLADSALAVTQ